jgi:hypothetical protein
MLLVTLPLRMLATLDVNVESSTKSYSVELRPSHNAVPVWKNGQRHGKAMCASALPNFCPNDEPNAVVECTWSVYDCWSERISESPASRTARVEVRNNLPQAVPSSICKMES